MTPIERLAKIRQTLDDYSEELWADPDVQTNLMYLLGRFLMTGEDLSDSELDKLDKFLKDKVEQFVKQRGN